MKPLVSRRAMTMGALASAAPLALPRALKAQSGVFDVDVAIVGAGAAGLAAARESQRLGRSFVILESRERIGGRTFTDTSLGQPFDAGALYIHWAERNPWTEAARALGVETISERNGAFRIYDQGRPQPPFERERRRAAFRRLSLELDEATDAPDVSVVERVASAGPDVIDAAGGMTRMALGEEPERVSARDYARLWSGDDLIMPGGYGTLAARYGEGLPVRLSTPVTAIDWGGTGVALATPAGTVRARAAIVTAPVGVLIEESIRFTPRLPETTLAGIGGLAMGVLAKIALKFDGARFDIPPESDLFEIEGPGATWDFACWPFGRDLVVAYLGGDHARRVVGLGAEDAVRAALDAFSRIVGPEAGRRFVAGRAHGWIDDPHALGAYSHALPGHAGARALLAKPVGGRLWFAGEATGGAPDFGGAMTAGGAFLAGRDAARAAAGQ